MYEKYIEKNTCWSKVWTWQHGNLNHAIFPQTVWPHWGVLMATVGARCSIEMVVAFFLQISIQNGSCEMSMCISTAQARTNAFRLRSLAQNGCRGIGVRHLSSKFPQKGSSDMCMCISTAQDRTKCASRSWDRFFSSTSSSSTSSSSSSCSTSTSSSSSHHHHHHHHHQHHPLPRPRHPHHHHHHHHEPHQYHHNYSAVSFCPPPPPLFGVSCRDNWRIWNLKHWFVSGIHVKCGSFMCDIPPSFQIMWGPAFLVRRCDRSGLTGGSFAYRKIPEDPSRDIAVL